MFPGSFKYYVIEHKAGKWSAKFYRHSLVKLIYEIESDSILTAAFIELKTNNVFSLPDQSKLKLGGGVIDDGIEYLLEYKIEGKTGSYSYQNPEDYLEQNRDVNELRFFCNIVNVFQKLFPNQQASKKSLRSKTN